MKVLSSTMYYLYRKLAGPVRGRSRVFFQTNLIILYTSTRIDIDVTVILA